MLKTAASVAVFAGGGGTRGPRMAGAGQVLRDEFVGRSAELALLAARADAATRGEPSVVWIEGEAGTGKTTLVRRALAALPEAFTIIRAEADELTQDVPFSLVSELGVRTSVAGFAAGLELLERWSGERPPLAVVVEDFHWADTSSRSALLTAARRLREDRVMLLITSRPSRADDGWERLRFDSERCLTMTLGALSTTEVADMARRRGVNLSRRSAERLATHTRGHPLHVRTLLSELPAWQLEAAEGALPAPRSLASMTLARLAKTPSDSRALAAALAVLNQRSPLQVLTTVAGVDAPTKALDDLIASELVNCDVHQQPPLVGFVHPLFRAAIYADLAPTRRQQLHRRAAAVLGGRASLAHLVAATDQPDEGLAAQLDEAAAAEVSRGSFSLAANYLLWSSHVSSQPSWRERTLLAAAHALLQAGQTASVERLRPQIEACRPTAMRSLVLGLVARDQGRADEAERLLREAAEDRAPDAAQPAAEALAQLATLSVIQVQGGAAVETATRALAHPGADPRIRRVALQGRAFGEALVRGPVAGLDLLAEHLPDSPADMRSADTDLLVTRGSLCLLADRLAAGITDLRAAVRLGSSGPPTLIQAHLRLSQLLFDAGDWDEATVQANVALSLLSDERLSWMEAQAHSALACVLASRGDREEAEHHLAIAQGEASKIATAEAQAMLRIGGAMVARAGHDPTGIIEALGPLAGIAPHHDAATTAALAHVRALGLGIMWWPTLVGALLDHGDLELASRQIQELGDVAVTCRLDFSARIAGLEARLCAALGHAEQAEPQFRQAVRSLGPDDSLLDRAELHHAFGRFLLARGERRAAVDQLRHAHQLLTSVGARPYVERVEADLGASGIAAPAGPGQTLLDLTERERDVVALVAKGFTNREVARELYVSANTVEYHLRNVFAKLGIRSRRDLRVLAGRATA